MKVKIILFMSFVAILFGVEAKCGLDWEKLYFKDNEGEREYNSKTKKYELYYETYHSFKPSYPASVNIHLPFKGDCTGISFKSLKSYRMIGPQNFSGNEKTHERHGLAPIGLHFEKSPFEYVDIKSHIEGKEFILKKVKIRDALLNTKEGRHVWKMRFDIHFKGIDGIDNKRSHIADFPLIH